MSSRAAEEDRPTGPIRSYVLRRSHFSAAQRDAHDRLMPVFGIPFSKAPLDLPALFGRRAPTILEIGFGMGETTAQIAAAHPEQDYLGVEVHTPGVGALLKLVQACGLTNVRVIEHDVQEVLEHQIADRYLTGIHIFFPDPWPKSRHHKRRLIQKQFINKIAAKLLPGGYLHLATDWPDYARQMAEAVDDTAALSRITEGAVPAANAPTTTVSDPAQAASTSLPLRPLTKFEKRGLTLGHPITDIIAIRRSA